MSSDANYDYLLSLSSVREQAKVVHEAAVSGGLTNFDFHQEKLDSAAEYVVGIILRDWTPEQFTQIPPHGRWQHFGAGSIPRLDQLVEQMRVDGLDDLERARSVIDVIVVSVLLDAGAGDDWKYTEQDLKIGRSEGLAVASFHAFKAGIFGKDCVDAHVLVTLEAEKFAALMQSTPENPLLGVNERCGLLRSLGRSLVNMPEIFGSEKVRPGNIVDYLVKNSKSDSVLSFETLWNSLQALLIPAWPTDRTTVDGKAVGDAWPLKVLKRSPNRAHGPIQPFHKLTQWLAYSLTSAIARLLNIKWDSLDSLTGLPEYRNGGFLVDTGVLSLKPEVLAKGLQASSRPLPQFSPADDVIVEWRALTVSLLDIVALAVNEKLQARFGSEVSRLSLAQVLEAGTWKAGRELAQSLRPEFKACSPILTISDGTLF